MGQNRFKVPFFYNSTVFELKFLQNYRLEYFWKNFRRNYLAKIRFPLETDLLLVPSIFFQPIDGNIAVRLRLLFLLWRFQMDTEGLISVGASKQREHFGKVFGDIICYFSSKCLPLHFWRFFETSEKSWVSSVIFLSRICQSIIPPVKTVGTVAMY